MAIVFLTATGAWYFTIQKQLKNQAISDCLKTSSVSTFGGDANNSHTFSEPIMTWYQTCMKEKGYE